MAYWGGVAVLAVVTSCVLEESSYREGFRSGLFGCEHMDLKCRTARSAVTRPSLRLRISAAR
jgi:hypothetical protein